MITIQQGVRMSILLAVLMTAAHVGSTYAKVDTPWLPWLGCWTLVEDDVREPLFGAEELSESQIMQPRGLVCMEPEDGGVRVTTFSDDELFLDEMIYADGKRQPSSAGQCVGWQEVGWSAEADRLFTRSELTCEEGHERGVTGVSLFTDRRTWVEIQTIGSGVSRTVVVRHYRPAREEETLSKSGLSPQILSSASQARAEIAKVMSIDDVIEAKSQVAPATLEALLMEHEDGFDLDREALIRLDDAGMPPSLIDVMVALSYPDQFLVERDSMPTSFTWSRSLGYPYHYAPFGYYYRYAPYGPAYVVRPMPGVSVSHQVTTASGGYAVVSRRSTSSYSSGSSQGSSSTESSDSGASDRGFHRGGTPSRGTAKPKN
jgi:hypothetical protein